MTHDSTKNTRVLAVDPSTRGFGFAVLEGPDRLIDWGTRSARSDKHRQCVSKVGELVDCYEPSVLVVEDCSAKDSRRCARVRRLIDAIVGLAKERKIRTRRFSREQVQAAFSKFGAATKHEIAVAIAERFPELAPHVPRYRKAWMSEDHAQSVFDAVGLGVGLFKSIKPGVIKILRIVDRLRRANQVQTAQTEAAN